MSSGHSMIDGKPQESFNAKFSLELNKLNETKIVLFALYEHSYGNTIPQVLYNCQLEIFGV